MFCEFTIIVFIGMILWKQIHAWNYNPETEEYIDLTANQFDPLLPDVFVVSRNSHLARTLYEEHRIT